MKSYFTAYSTILISAACYAIILLICCSPLTAQTFKLYAVNDLDRVFEDGYNLPAMHDTMKIFGIKGEIISGQCALQAKSNLTNVTVIVTDLKNLITGIPLSVKDVEWNFVGSIPLTKNAPNQPKSAVVRIAPARFPDYLMSEKQINVKENSYQSIWLTINIPDTIIAGTYIGKIIVKSTQGEQSLPISITVYPLILPSKRHLKVTEWYNTDNFSKFHGIKETYSEAWFRMLRRYADNMVEHRQNVFQVPINTIEIQRFNNGELEFDFSRFDQIAQVFWDTKKMDYLETGELAKFGGEGHWESNEIVLKDFLVKNIDTSKKETLPGKEVIPYLLPAFESHLRGKGWLDKTLFHVKDEPSLHNALAWREISSYLHQFAPDLRRIDAIGTTFLSDNIEIAVPELDCIGTWTEDYRKAARKGIEIWFYTVGIFQAGKYPNKTIDMPLMDNRILHWLNYKYDLAGYLHWGWNAWTENPYLDVGKHIGDGWHVYPVKNGVLNSLRWEQMRNGLQDYEYFRMLEDKISILKDSLGSRFSWIDPKQRGKEIAGKIVTGFAEHSNDPQLLYKAKREIINELLEFNTAPRIYVQINSGEKSRLLNRTSVEIYGWTELGTKIVINGQELPISKQGLFLLDFSLSPNENIIKVQASNAKGSKEIIRSYVVE